MKNNIKSIIRMTGQAAKVHTLIQFNATGNNNKFYKVELAEDNDTVIVRYGRVGSNGTCIHHGGGQYKFDALIRAKRRKGYSDAMIEGASTESETYPSDSNVLKLALEEIRYKDDEAKAVVQAVCRRNVHKITEATSIAFDESSGMFRTPLGVVKREGVEEAMSLLDQIEALMPEFQQLRDSEPDATVLPDLSGSRKRKAPDSSETLNPASPRLCTLAKMILDLNEKYYVIIPNRVKNARNIDSLLFSQKAVDEQRATCDALFSTLDLMADLAKKASEEASKEKGEETEKKEKTFGVEIETVSDAAQLALIRGMFEATKNIGHGQYNSKCTVTKAYKVKLDEQHEMFDPSIGNVTLLWHGTKTENVLSILSKGILLPSESPGSKAGSAFGKGVYFARQSTKSLNYCDGGFWSGNQSSTKIYMFVASVAIGNSFVPTGMVSAKPPKGYDSYWAQPGISGVLNDEIVVFKPSQIRLDYLLEIDRPW